MSVWLAIPSAREESQSTLPIWKARGYKVAVFRDPGASPVESADLILSGEYPGYARATNALCAEILSNDLSCDWIVGGGDDVQPDMQHRPEQIAFKCGRHFGEVNQQFRMEPTSMISTGDMVSRHYTARMFWSTFGVMQPTGDRFASGSIDRIAGSPWMGREWCMRANGGQGPFYPEFTHCFGDEALQRTAEKLGVFWQRPDLIHLHLHFMRKTLDVNSPAVTVAIPPHLRMAFSPQHWDESQALFRRLEADGFAACMPSYPGAEVSA